MIVTVERRSGNEQGLKGKHLVNSARDDEHVHPSESLLMRWLAGGEYVLRGQQLLARGASNFRSLLHQFFHISISSRYGRAFLMSASTRGSRKGAEEKVAHPIIPRIQVIV